MKRLLLLSMGLLGSCDALDVPMVSRDGGSMRVGEFGEQLPDCALATLCPELAIDPERCIDDLGWFEVTTLEREPIALRVTRTANLALLEAGPWYGVIGADCASALAVQFEVLPSVVATTPTDSGVAP